ncbi:MAG: T9SS type A sorting domain-containing protein, partial [Bacteroidales bacterium]|nr:T9SS type A sorting domain-containing protein [Bacteroidales bacterium]
NSDNVNDQRLQSVAVSTRENGHVLDVWFATSKQGLGYYSYNGIKPADAIEDVISETPEAVLVYTGTEIQVEGVQAANIAVYSITGALVRNESNSNIVNVEGLHGVYIAVVVDTEGNTFTKKFVLK